MIAQYKPHLSEPVLTDTEFLYENSPCGYLTFYADGTIIKINQTLSSWLGFGNDEIIGRIKFSSLLSKGGQFYYQMVVLPLLQMNGKVNEINFEIKGKNENFPCLFSASTVVSKDGSIIAINAIILNITDRKRYESQLLSARQNAEEEKKRFEFLSNSVPNIIWTALPSGRINFVNNRYYETFGCKSNSLRFNSFLHLIHLEQRKQTLEAWKTALAEKIKFSAEVRCKTAKQQYEWFLIDAVPYLDSMGIVSNWFGSCTNINLQKETERRKVEQLNDSLQLAGEVNHRNSQTLRQIAFDQSHLIRHPLSNILGITNLLKDMELNNQVKQMIDMLEVSAEKLDIVIKEIVNKTYSGSSAS